MYDEAAIPFLDSEFNPYESELRRPWSVWWPPKYGDSLHVYLQRECPEALSWRFDPLDPFDRPWQKWTRSRCAQPTAAFVTDAPAPIKLPSDDGDLTHKRGPHSVAPNNTGTPTCLTNLPFVVPTVFNYLAPLDCYLTQKPYHSRLPFLNGLRRTNVVSQPYHGVRIHDLSDQETTGDFDKQGFTYLKAPITAASWTDEWVKSDYLPQMQMWLRKHFDAADVFIYTYNFRSTHHGPAKGAHWIAPFTRAHCDVTENSRRSKIELHLPNIADQILSGRHRFVNVWRPLNGPNVDSPLAVCDASTVKDSDLVSSDILFPHHCDEGYEVYFNPAHRWYYKKQMTADEIVMMRMYDSALDNQAYCPHSAFMDPSVSSDAPVRASLELRAIVIG